MIYQHAGAWLRGEFAILNKLTPAEIAIEHGRFCIAVNKSKLLVQSRYLQAATCRDHGVPGFDRVAANLATSLMLHMRQVQNTGC